MARLAGAALAAIILVHGAAAHAAVRYVSPGGSAAGTGASRHSPWTLARANAELQPGDVCVMLPGPYEGVIHPARSGTPGARITYVGRLDDPDDATVKSIELDQAWVTVKGVRSNSGATLDYPARHDSITRCELGYMGFHGAKHSIAVRNQINGPVAFLLDRAQTNAGKSNSEFDTLRANRIDLGTVIRWHSFKIRGYTQNCLIDSNRVTAAFDESTDDGVARIFYNSSHITLRDNSWRFEARSECPNHGEPWYGFAMRDSARYYLFERDTVLLGMNSKYRIRGLLNHSGSFPQSVSDNRWVDCVYRTNSYMYSQDRFIRSAIESSLFAGADERALWFAEPVVSSRFDGLRVISAGHPQRFERMFDAAVVASTGGRAGAVTDLAPDLVNQRELVLTWTAPTPGGGFGTPRAYELRYATSPITSSNFSRARAVQRQPMAMKPGTGQSYVMLGLQPGTRYWFALRARDGAGHWTPVSNVASATTTGEGSVARGGQRR